MTIKKIKKILIGDCNYDIIWDKENNDGEFSFSWKGKNGFIRIGTREEKNNPERVLNILIHELKEIIQVEQMTRYKDKMKIELMNFIIHIENIQNYVPD